MAFALSNCGGPPNHQSVHATSNPKVPVELLFEIDGCKVYRFNDEGTKYFCNCSGSVEWTEAHRSGKATIYMEKQIPTNVTPQQHDK